MALTVVILLLTFSSWTGSQPQGPQGVHAAGPPGLHPGNHTLQRADQRLRPGRHVQLSCLSGVYVRVWVCLCVYSRSVGAFLALLTRRELILGVALQVFC